MHHRRLPGRTGRTCWCRSPLLGLAIAGGGLAGMALEEALGIDWFEFLEREEDRRVEELGGRVPEEIRD